ncbi:thiamine pyrophosphate-dependent enzyme [Zobellia nedashkovskayae]
MVFLLLLSAEMQITPKNFMQYDKSNLSEAVLLKLYKDLLRPRMIEEKMLILLRQGKISKWFSGIGQEAISVGVTNVLNEEEYILPMHRNLAVFTTRGIPLHRLFSQWQGKMNGFTKGRDRSFHFGTQDYKIIGIDQSPWSAIRSGKWDCIGRYSSKQESGYCCLYR